MIPGPTVPPPDNPPRPPSRRGRSPTGVNRMIRHPLTRTALAAGLFGLLAAAATAQGPARPDVSPQTQKINELIAKGWESAGVKKPADRANDHEFLRRAFIDIVGRIATPEEVIDFEQDKSPNKRAKLVARLLYQAEYQPRENGRPIVSTVINGDGSKSQVTLTFAYQQEYADHWADLWTVWL